MKLPRLWVVWVAGCLLAVMVGAANEPTVSTEREPVHDDPQRVEAGLVTAVLGYVDGDLERVREGLAEIEAGCKRLEPSPEIPSDLSAYDQVFHTALTRTREYAARGDYDRSFEQFFWIQKGCHTCHERAAEKRPAEEPQPTGDPAGTKSSPEP